MWHVVTQRSLSVDSLVVTVEVLSMRDVIVVGAHLVGTAEHCSPAAVKVAS